MSHFKLTPAIESARIRKVERDSPMPVLEPEAVIRRALSGWNNPCVSWSGGKCSTVVLHMALQQNPDIRVIFNDTGVEFPETYAFIERMAKEWSLNLETLKPRQTFWKVVKKYGFPMLRGQYKDNSLSKDGRPMCCQILKEEPIKRAHLNCCITGIRASESRVRTLALADRGQFYYAKTLKRWQFHPLATWTSAQVWEYHKKHNLPHNEVYDKGQERCGCWPCTGYISWKTQLAKSHPEIYRTLSRLKGEPTLWEYEDGQRCRQGGMEP